MAWTQRMDHAIERGNTESEEEGCERIPSFQGPHVYRYTCVDLALKFDQRMPSTVDQCDSATVAGFECGRSGAETADEQTKHDSIAFVDNPITPRLKTAAHNRALLRVWWG